MTPQQACEQLGWQFVSLDNFCCRAIQHLAEQGVWIEGCDLEGYRVGVEPCYGETLTEALAKAVCRLEVENV